MKIDRYLKVNALFIICLLPVVSFAQAEFFTNWKGKLMSVSEKLGDCEISISESTIPDSVDVVIRYTDLKGQADNPIPVKGFVTKYSDSDEKLIQVKHTVTIERKKYEGVLILNVSQQKLSGQFVTLPAQEYLPYYWFWDAGQGSAANTALAQPTAYQPQQAEPYNGVASGNYLASGAKIMDIDEFLLITKGKVGIKKGSKYAVIDSTGTLVVPWGKYEIPAQLNSYASKYGVIEARDVENNVYCLLSAGGDVLYSSTYRIEVNPLGLAVVGHSPDLKVVDTSGKEIPLLSKILGERNAFNRFEFGFMNNYYDFFIPDLERMLICISRSGEGTTWGYVSRSGNVTIPFRQYVSARPFSEGMAAVCKLDEFNEQKWGFINVMGDEVIPCQFTNEPSSFMSGVALVRPTSSTEMAFAYINKSGDIVYTIPKGAHNSREIFLIGEVTGQSFTPVGSYSNGYTIQNDAHETQFYLVDTLGNRRDLNAIIKGHHFDSTPNLHPMIDHHNLNGIYFRSHNGTHNRNAYGILNHDGTVRIPPLFDYLSITLDPFSNLAIASQHIDPHEGNGPKHRFGVINKEGLYIILKGDGGIW